MDMNLLAAQFKTPTSSSSDSAASPVSTAQSPNSTTTRKSFSSALHRAYQERNRPKAQKSNDTQSQDGPNTATREPHTSNIENHESKPEDSRSHSTETSTGDTQDNQQAESSVPVSEDRDTSPIKSGIDSVSQAQLLALMQAPTPDTVSTQPVILELQSTTDEMTTASIGGQATAQTVAPMLMPLPSTKNPDTVAPIHQTDIELSATTTPVTQDRELPVTEKVVPELQNPLSQALEPEPLALREAPLYTTVDARGEAIPVVAPQQPPIENSNPLDDHSFELHRDQARQDTITSPVLRDSERSCEDALLQRPAPPQADQTGPSLHVKDAINSKSAPELPHDWQSFCDFEQQSDMQGFAREDKPRERDETSLSQGASMQNLFLTESHAPTATALTAGTVAQPMPRALENHAAQPVTPAQPMMTAHDASDLPMPAATRSVVFEVAQPDLGRINVRVSMTHELVHTHFSSDHSEVGQFLINGQDRLQSSLHANGLDLGQFHVDIHRQSAGRSFQQEQPQEQARPWHHSAGQQSGDAPADAHDIRLTRPHGMLNLVA